MLAISLRYSWVSIHGLLNSPMGKGNKINSGSGVGWANESMAESELGFNMDRYSNLAEKLWNSVKRLSTVGVVVVSMRTFVQ